MIVEEIISHGYTAKTGNFSFLIFFFFFEMCITEETIQCFRGFTRLKNKNECVGRQTVLWGESMYTLVWKRRGRMPAYLTHP